MARGRMIDKRVSMSKKLGAVMDKERVLWFMIYPHLDREGRIKFADLEDLKDEIIPKFKDWNLKKIAVALNGLADIELIQLYPDGKQIAMQFERFDDFQVGLHKEREAKSKVASPGGAPETSGNYRITPETSPLRKEGSLSLSLSLRKFKEGMKEEEEAKINFDPISKCFKNIKEEDLNLWKEAYPACDIEMELKKMVAWLLADWPKRRRPNCKKFIVNWLTNQQQQGGTKGMPKKPGESRWLKETKLKDYDE